MKRALEGLRKYQQAQRPAPSSPMPAFASHRGATLRDYGGEGPPVVFLPSLINPPNILDLSEDRSLLRWLTRQGRRVFLLDWGWPDQSRSAISVSGHVEGIAIPLLAQLPERADLVGYCLGGTMALAAAAIAPARSVVTIAAPWHFSAYPDPVRTDLARLWSGVRPTVEALGVLPMEALQTAFWNLDPERTIGKFEAFAELQGVEAETFVTLEDWANDGPPVSAASALEMFEDFFASDLPGNGRWKVGDRNCRPEALDIPILNIVSTSDRIVPQTSAPAVGERLELNQGHVGMVVGSGRARLWQALADWLSRTAANC